ncbi:MAG TPA: hypothetical protein PLQ69_07220 [Paludibacter sp.]|nr:hypothetical protein [Paludibacter sp.]
MSLKSKLIGGKFGFPAQFLNAVASPHFLQGNPALLFNARSGIKLVVDQLKSKQIWLPSFLCDSIITAIDPSISKISFYPIDDLLNVQSEDFIAKIHSEDIFLLIDYFGFPIDSGLIRKIRARGCKILRDCSQALFFDWNDELCDFHLFSPRKFLGVPDGGILHWQKNISLHIPTLDEPEQEVMYPLLQALILRRDFDLHKDDKEWLLLFREAESHFKPEYRAMSQLTTLLLTKAFDYDFIKKQRQKNFRILALMLPDLAIYRNLPDGVTPLGFPIRYYNRKFLQKQLFARNIFPPIHWVIDTYVPHEFEKSHKLSQQILTLPCDHRYTEEDMIYLANAVLEIVG